MSEQKEKMKDLNTLIQNKKAEIIERQAREQEEETRRREAKSKLLADKLGNLLGFPLEGWTPGYAGSLNWRNIHFNSCLGKINASCYLPNSYGYSCVLPNGSHIEVDINTKEDILEILAKYQMAEDAVNEYKAKYQKTVQVSHPPKGMWGEIFRDLLGR